MRDLLNDLTEGLSHPDPIRRSQIQMQKPLPKRFYKHVTVGETEEGGFTVLLDGKTMRTPAKSVLTVPTRALAQLLRDEWDAQVEVVDPTIMPVSRHINTAIDGIASDPQAVFEDILRFSSSDLLCYRAGEPQALVERQSEQWDPIIDWAANTLGARFILVEGVMHQDQPREAIAAFAVTVRKYDTPIELAALHTMTTLTGSALLALALAEGERSVEEIWALAHLDENWTAEQWGEDDDAQVRTAKRFVEMRAAVDVLHAARANHA
ncbi:chaperone required for assembly of F1-ATPase [Rhizobium skierniewicense]|uniref:Chaperone required for assembly of F1-ATPase n=1 Tax=Rhizobium skierniewicense TaxID=984260 RepID=A0A7W6G2M0_9HYPH|nr:ATP12 family chaperone protein [Rhizobium skierniewicense]MBB3946955.1 chaperone required for assembly of F1-ATPase [Rhizobium skierniewicense]